MNKEEFLEKYERKAVHCDTEEKANEFLELCDKFDIKWYDEHKATEFNYWACLENKTCYDLKKGCVDIGSLNWYKSNNYEIIEFQSLKENQQNNNETNILKIENYLLRKGFKPNLLGFDCIVEAIVLVQNDKTYLRNITKKLYYEISKSLKITKNNVERSIRHSIAVSGLYFTNSEFIARAIIELKGVN